MRQEDQWKAADRLKRKIYVKYEIRKQLLQSITKNMQISPLVRLYARYKLEQLPKYSCKSQHKTRCLISGRSYAVMRFARYSRFAIIRES
jgi:ribosomal protein S14